MSMDNFLFSVICLSNREGGLLPILKEMVEILFSRNLIKGKSNRVFKMFQFLIDPYRKSDPTSFSFSPLCYRNLRDGGEYACKSCCIQLYS
jgi:hypothetical protein